MSRVHLALLLVALPGCVATLRRSVVEARILREHYGTTAFDHEQLRALWESLDPITEYGCMSIVRPCRVPQTENDAWCFMWGKERTCFKPAATGLEHVEGDKGNFTEQWLYEHLDPDFATTRANAEQAAEAEVSAEEKAPTDANSFWATTRAVVQAPLFTLGQHFQAGYRRWLEHYVLLSIGGGYERTYTASRGFGEPRDAMLFTARFELSVFDDGARKRLNLPPVSAYFGLTGVLGVSPQVSWTTRGFLGVSAIIPVSIELGYSLAALPQGTFGQFYLAAGLAL